MVLYGKLQKAERTKHNLFSLEPLRNVERAETTKFTVKKTVIEIHEEMWYAYKF